MGAAGEFAAQASDMPEGEELRDILQDCVQSHDVHARPSCAKRAAQVIKAFLDPGPALMTVQVQLFLLKCWHPS